MSTTGQFRTRALGKDYIEYANSRKKFMQRISLSQIRMLVSLEPSTVKLGIANKPTQYLPNRFDEQTQTDEIILKDQGNQTPNIILPSNFPSTIQFLKTASATILSLFEQTEFAESKKASPLSRISHLAAPSPPQQIVLTSTRTAALISSQNPFGRILVWNSRSNEANFFLSSPSDPSCFCGYGDGRFYISGNENGSLTAWDLTKTNQLGYQKDNFFVLLPIFSTEKSPNNHKRRIVSVSVFGRKGSNALCVLDRGAEVSFWYIRNEADEIEFVCSDRKKLSPTYSPAFSITVSPTSVNSYLAGVGNYIHHGSRFGQSSHPSKFITNASVTHLEFSPLIPNMFLACCDNGTVGIFDVGEQIPLLVLSVDIYVSQMCASWSPTRSSVIFVADKAGTRLSVFDLTKSFRKPVMNQGVGSSVLCISSVQLTSGVVVATGEGSNHLSIIRCGPELSAPLTNKEQKNFLRKLSAT